MTKSVAGAMCALMLVAAPACSEPAENRLAVGDLLKGGWQIAGFTNTLDNRSALILFRHPSESYLVQCRTGYDVTRSPPVYTNCYEIR